MSRRIRQHDWAATPLGPVENWPASLKILVQLMLAQDNPSCICVGQEGTLIYNDGYAATIGAKHPAVLGASVHTAFAEVDFYPIYARAMAGEATPSLLDALMPRTRDGEIEQAWFDISYTPVRDENGEVFAVLFFIKETTPRVLAEGARDDFRVRQTLVLQLSDALRQISDPHQVQYVAMQMLGEHLHVSRAFYYSAVREAGDWIHVVEQDFHRDEDAQSLIGRFPRIAFGGEIFTGLELGRDVAAEDVRRHPLVTPDEVRLYADLGIVSFAAVPLLSGGVYVGGVCVQDAAPRAWSAADLALIRDVSERTWAAVERARAETALRESEERLRMALEAGRMGTWRFDLATGRQQWSEQQFKLFGLQPDSQPPTRDFFLSLVHPDDLPLIEYTPEDLEPGRGLLDAEFRIVRPDGEMRWLVSHTTVRRNADGEPVEMIGLNWDVTDRKQAELTLRETEERFRQFGEASSDVLWIRGADSLQWEYLTPSFEAIYGEDRDAALEGNNLRNWVDMILPEDREHALDNIRRVREGERVTFEYRVARPSDGQVRWLRNTDFPLRDAAGNVQRIGGIGHDATQEKEAAGRQQVLVAELQHRTRNLLTIVRSLADKTIKESASLADFRERYSDRLKAVARVQGLLSRLDGGRKITFDRLLETELSALGVLDASHRVTLHGPSGITLRSSTVQTFALALHELATNAVKYGALASPQGRLKVRWGVVPGDTGRRLTVEWRESGVVMPEADALRQGGGYGRELIERALPYQLKATTSYELGPDGVCCTITVPVSEAVEPGEKGDV